MAITAKNARDIAKAARRRTKLAEIEARKEERKQRRETLTKLQQEIKRQAPKVLESISGYMIREGAEIGHLYFRTGVLSDYVSLDNEMYGSEPGEIWEMLAKKVSVLLRNRGFRVKILTDKKERSLTRFHINY
mgnify:CR=1 FL=1